MSIYCMAPLTFATSTEMLVPQCFRTQLGWAEGSLVMAENILLDYFGASPSSWMREYTRSAVRFGPTYADFEDVAQICFPPT